MRHAAILLLALVATASSYGQYTRPLYAKINGKNYRLNSEGYCCNNPNCWMRAEAHRQWLLLTGGADRAPSEQEKIAAMKAANETLVPMPDDAIAALMQLIDPDKGQTLYDLGCGDGRILSYANRFYQLSVLGIEINQQTYFQAVARMKLDGCKGWRVLRGDATRYSLEEADIVTMYLYPHVMDRVRFETLKPGAIVVSYMNDIDGLETAEHRVCLNGKTHVFFIYKHA